EAQARNTAGSRTEATRRDELRLVRRRDQNAHRGSGRGTLKRGVGLGAWGSGQTSAAASRELSMNSSRSRVMGVGVGAWGSGQTSAAGSRKLRMNSSGSRVVGAWRQVRP